MGKLEITDNGRRYTCSLRVRLSKNYQSIEVGSEFGRNANAAETTDRLISDVDETTWASLQNLVKRGAEALDHVSKPGGHA